MNEKSPQTDYYVRKPEQVYKRFYQASATELLYNALVLANPDQSIRQPSQEDGRQTIELIPSNKSWDNLCIIVHPAGEYMPVSGELQATIQLGQSFFDKSGVLEPTGLEFIQEYNVYYSSGQYSVLKRNLLCDYANPDLGCMVTIYEKESLADKQELDELNKIINRSTVRPADFDD